jgi:hypothetical protein
MTIPAHATSKEKGKIIFFNTVYFDPLIHLPNLLQQSKPVIIALFPVKKFLKQSSFVKRLSPFFLVGGFSSCPVYIFIF